MASRFLAQFEVEVTDWQKQLATVTDVFGLFTEIQKTTLGAYAVNVGATAAR